MEDLLQVGVFSSTHGVRGEFKVFPTTDDVTRFSDLDKVIMDTGKRQFEVEIEGVKYFKQFAILKIRGYNSLNDIEPLKGSTLWVTRENAVELAQDEYFIADLIGMQVYLEDDSFFGTLKDVIETGANDVYEVVDEKKKTWYLPAIGECILSVNIEENKMKVHLMPGLEEL